MKLLRFFSLILFFVSCGRNPAIKDDYDRLVDAEINRRYEILKQTDSLLNRDEISLIHKEVSQLILLSKDAENAGNVIESINMYFTNTVKKFNIPYEGFVVILKTMNLKTIEASIKTNELNLLDKIIFTQASITNDSVMMGSVY
ncbi:MAG: hypothetical protein J0L69_12210 [Bacteroidetes bacterium]|nr:hypothetical protein [Bacteroidota bacterium]